MDITAAILIFLAGALVGAIAGWMSARSRLLTQVAVAQARLEESARNVARLEEEVQARTAALEQAHREIAALREEQARIAVRLEDERRAAAEKLALLQDAEAKLRDAFAALSSEALRSNSQSFLELAKTSLAEFQALATRDLEGRQTAIAGLVQPLHDALSRVDLELQKVDRARVESHSALAEQLRALAVTTSGLERALRTPHVRGRWGELQLRRVVEMADMIEHCDFLQQPSAAGDEGRLTPDLIVKLPEGKQVVVDAKAPLQAYLDAFEATDDAIRDERLKEHARQVREHIKQLSEKAYWEQFQPAPEFVLMFLPGENLFSAALQHDPGLIEFGVSKRVIPASPLTLIALLRAVASGWRQERLAENAEAISTLGRELYDRIRRMADAFDDLGKGLRRAIDAYNSAIGTLESRVLVTARKFRDLAVSTPTELPQLDSVDQTPRALRAPELADLPGDAEIVEGEAVPHRRDED